jgi:hypothetical protein
MGSVTINSGDRFATSAVAGQVGNQATDATLRVRTEYSTGSEVIKGIISVVYT